MNKNVLPLVNIIFPVNTRSLETSLEQARRTQTWEEVMTTYTICYSGTDCFLDQGLVMRKPKEIDSYNPASGYIPSKIFNVLTQNQVTQEGDQANCTTMNGCGEPYTTNYKSLPVRIWSIRVNSTPDSTPFQTGNNDDLYTQCSTAPSSASASASIGSISIGLTADSLSGKSVEIISIASIAQMLGITLHLIPKGSLDDIEKYWSDKTSMGYSKSDIAYPEKNSKWNNTPQATEGNYCLRWSKEDNDIINVFLKKFNTVVLLGHSRGGVSCLITSNYLAEWFRSLKIKIIALDPVPGPGVWGGVLTHIPAIINMEYVGIYAIDETSSGFNGVVPRVKGINQSKNEVIWDPLSPTSNSSDIQNWSKENYELLYARGRHATIPGSRSSYGQGDTDTNNDDVGASGNLVNAYVINKLTQWGINLTPSKNTNVNNWIKAVKTPVTVDHFKKMRDYHYVPGDNKKVSITLPLVGEIGGRFYYNARGISSSEGANPSNWNYLEAFIPLLSEKILNDQRGLVTFGKDNKDYKKFAGSGNVHKWTYLPDVFAPLQPQNSHDQHQS